MVKHIPPLQLQLCTIANFIIFICLLLEGNFEALLVSIVYSQMHGGGERTQGFVYEWKNALMSAGNTQAQQREDWHVTIL